jgi:hypothetical protein
MNSRDTMKRILLHAFFPRLKLADALAGRHGKVLIHFFVLYLASAWVMIRLTGTAFLLAMHQMVLPTITYPLLERGASLSQAAAWLPAPDSGGSAPTAGETFHLLGYGGHDSQALAEAGIAPVQTTHTLSVGRRPSFDRTGVEAHPVAARLLAASDSVTSVDEGYQNYPSLMVSSDGVDLFQLLARAPRWDLVGERFRGGVPAPFHLQPYPRIGAFREAVYLKRVEVAVAIAEGRAADAEAIARDILGFGYRWHAEAPTPLESLVAAFLARVGLESLHAALEAEGRVDDVAEVAAILEARASDVPVRAMRMPWRAGDRSRFLRELASYPGAPRSLLADQLGYAESAQVCTHFPLVSLRNPLALELEPFIVQTPDEAAWYRSVGLKPARSIVEWPGALGRCMRAYGRVVAAY